jgi:hypothetical protein
MTVMMCSGGCPRLLSVSRIAGGNPIAVNDPENWAVVFWHCTTCPGYYCDRCVTQTGGAVPRCSRCGSMMSAPNLDELH